VNVIRIEPKNSFVLKNKLDYFVIKRMKIFIIFFETSRQQILKFCSKTATIANISLYF